MIMVLFSALSLPPIKEGVSDAWGKSQRDKGPLFLPPLVFTGGGGGGVKGNPQLLVCPLGDLKKAPAWSKVQTLSCAEDRHQ